LALAVDYATSVNYPDPPPDSLFARALPDIKSFDMIYNRPANRRAVIPAAGGVMNARSLARNYAALIGDGVDGVQLLPPERIRSATTVQTDAVDSVLGRPIRMGLGYSLGRPTASMSERVSAFGYGGCGGSTAFADPEHGFTFALTKNRLAARGPGEGAAERVAAELRRVLRIPEA
jgi:CubicO group peptidase (beta-lactamase class C family)